MLKLFTRKPAGHVRDSIALDLGNGRTVDVARVRHPRARSLKLSVDERGIRLTLPVRASQAAADRFLLAHREWLRARLEELALAHVEPLRPFVTARLPLRGDWLPVEWSRGTSNRVHLADGVLHMQVRGAVDGMHASPALRRALQDFYMAEARADIARWLPDYLPDLPRAPTRITLKRMVSQWGSLSPAGVVALDLALVLAHPSAFRYVLVHELCHILHPDHSRAFWDAVDTRFPDWRDERAWFARDGRSLKATLHALLD